MYSILCRSLNIEVTFNNIGFFTGKTHKSYSLAKCLYSPLHIMWSPVALGADMKSNLAITDRTIKSQIRYVKLVSTIVGSLFTVFSGKFYLYLGIRILLKLVSLFLFTSSTFLIIRNSLSVVVYFSGIILISLTIYILSKFKKITKINFILLSTFLVSELFLCYYLYTLGN
jgi:hypothetical protein